MCKSARSVKWQAFTFSKRFLSVIWFTIFDSRLKSKYSNTFNWPLMVVVHLQSNLCWLCVAKTQFFRLPVTCCLIYHLLFLLLLLYCVAHFAWKAVEAVAVFMGVCCGAMLFALLVVCCCCCDYCHARPTVSYATSKRQITDRCVSALI